MSSISASSQSHHRMSRNTVITSGAKRERIGTAGTPPGEVVRGNLRSHDGSRSYYGSIPYASSGKERHPVADPDAVANGDGTDHHAPL